MLYFLLFGVVKFLFGDDIENENDEFNGEDIDMMWCFVFFYFLLLFGVKQLVVIGCFFEVLGDINFGIDGGVILGGGKKFEVEEVVDLEELVGNLVLVVNVQ